MQLINKKICMGKDIGIHGNMFGGILMAWIDEAAAAYATEYCYTPNMVAQKAATPLTWRDYTGTPTGALYGILKDVNKPNETTIATRTKIPNLLLTGQNVNLHGVLGVSITAVATCAELLGMEYLVGKIKR